MAGNNDVKIKVSLEGAEGVKKGLKGISDGASDTDSKVGRLVSGGLKGAGLAVAAFAAAAAAAGGVLVAGVIDQYAQYEQNIGGIDTLFKGASGKLQGYAQDAYKTAGLSANEYMSQVTSFSSALIQGLGGDTDAAAEIANRAVTDMSDNANKFGTNIGMIQNAYQGFAKQNFTMLDNLKLGYGGTASEMARLLNDSGVLEDGFVATAANVNSISYDTVIAGIGAVQDKLGITGTTAAEASSTISGSVATLKGAFANLLTGLGSADADVATLSGNLITSLEQVITNVGPIIDNIGTNIATLGPKIGGISQTIVSALASALPAVLGAGVVIVQGLLIGITSALPGLLGALTPALVSLVTVVAELAPQLITAGAEAIASLANGLASAAPTLIPILIESVLGMVQALIAAAPMLITAGVALLIGLVEGILSAIPMLVGALPGLITSIITALLSAIPLIIQAGITLITSLIGALPLIITTIVTALPQIITGIITAVLSAIPMLIQAGIELLVALIGALPTIIVAIVTGIPQIIDGIIGAIISAIPQLIQAGIQLITALIGALPQIIATIVEAVPQIISGLVSAFSSNKSTIISAGGDLVRGIWEGISGMAGWLFNKIGGFVNDVMSNIGSFFGIASPSKRMRDEIGQYLPEGIGVGVARNEDKALKPIQKLSTRIMDEASKLNTSANFTSTSSLTQTLIPLKGTATPQGPARVEASLDPAAIAAALTSGLTASPQAPAPISRESITQLATAIVDAIRVQSRQGVSVLG